VSLVNSEIIDENRHGKRLQNKEDMWSDCQMWESREETQQGLPEARGKDYTPTSSAQADHNSDVVLEMIATK
jgi:hypothetical protein